MATVWRAEHTTLDIPVAVKLMHETIVGDAEALARFRDEAAAASRLRSRHVVQVLDAGLVDGETPYLVMELLDGEDLGRRMSRVGPCEVKDVVRWVGQAARGLAAVHTEGIVHRDIKPQNLFLTEIDGEETLKVLDFGIARSTAARFSSTTATTQVIGTPFYMSPEQLTSPKRVDARTDLWSLSVVAYEALTGRVPFDGQTVGALAVAMDRGRFEPPSRVRPDLPKAIDRWFSRAFSPDAAARPPTASELSSSFAVAATSRDRKLLVPAGLGGVALAALAVSLSWSHQEARPSPTETAVSAPPPANEAAPAHHGAAAEPAPAPLPSSDATAVPASAPEPTGTPRIAAVARPAVKAAGPAAAEAPPPVAAPATPAPGEQPAAEEPTPAARTRKDRGF
jgi:serine/threonine-protein kinase